MHRTDDEGAVAATACALTAVATAAEESCAAVAVTDPVTDCAFTPGDGATCTDEACTYAWEQIFGACAVDGAGSGSCAYVAPSQGKSHMAGSEFRPTSGL